MKRFELPIYRSRGALRISGRKENDVLTVFLELARAFPGKERMIPGKGGEQI